jgi:hypothetical protein
MPDPDEAPDIKDHRGRWDEYLAGFIVVAPFILLLVGGLVLAALILTGEIDIGNITLGGTIPVGIISLGVAGMVGLTWLLAVMKIFGIAPVAWIANAANDYSNE